jgi:hypothetical protein
MSRRQDGKRKGFYQSIFSKTCLLYGTSKSMVMHEVFEFTIRNHLNRNWVGIFR